MERTREAVARIYHRSRSRSDHLASSDPWLEPKEFVRPLDIPAFKQAECCARSPERPGDADTFADAGTPPTRRIVTPSDGSRSDREFRVIVEVTPDIRGIDEVTDVARSVDEVTDLITIEGRRPIDRNGSDGFSSHCSDIGERRAHGSPAGCIPGCPGRKVSGLMEHIGREHETVHDCGIISHCRQLSSEHPEGRTFVHAPGSGGTGKRVPVVASTTSETGSIDGLLLESGPRNDAFKRPDGERIAMATLYDVPAEDLNEAVAVELAERLDEPSWAPFVKSGADREFPPEQEDFWYRRAASLLRRVAVDGPVGVERLSTVYGGSKQGSTRYKVAPSHRADGSQNVIRTILQDLEEAGLIERPPDDEGRVISADGRSLLDTTAGEVLEDLDRPELERYA